MTDPEMTRILSIERVGGPAPLLETHGLPALRPAQAACIVEWVRALRTSTPFGPPGIAALLGCGHGKTLVSLLLPHVAASITGTAPRRLHLVPASLVDQLRADAASWGLPLGTDEVLSHEALSAPSGRWRLSDGAPDLLLIDEAHRFADPASGRWRRVSEYLRLRPDTRVVILSGSLSWRSLRQARHLLLACLRGWCPLPVDRTIDHWSACVDVGAEATADDRSVLAPLRAWAGRDDDREAYQVRLRTTPGVVLTADVGVSASLLMTAWVPPRPPPEIAAAVRTLEERWELPDETPLVSSLEVARHGATMGLGLYQRWDPNTVDPQWVDRRRLWGSVVRRLVAYAPGAYQTPSVVTAAAERNALGASEMHVYRRWMEVADRPAPDLEDVWLPGAEDYLRSVVAAWHLGDDSIMWCATPAIGRALARVAGCTYHGAGTPAPTGGPAVVSYRVHGTGWDGAPRAGYRRALVVEPPSSGATWEQTLARLHRSGATDTVEITVALTTLHDRQALSAGVAGAEYIRATTGSDQRLLTADWSGWHVNRRARATEAA